MSIDFLFAENINQGKVVSRSQETPVEPEKSPSSDSNTAVDNEIPGSASTTKADHGESIVINTKSIHHDAIGTRSAVIYDDVVRNAIYATQSQLMDETLPRPTVVSNDQLHEKWNTLFKGYSEARLPLELIDDVRKQADKLLADNPNSEKLLRANLDSYLGAVNEQYGFAYQPKSQDPDNPLNYNLTLLKTNLATANVKYTTEKQALISSGQPEGVVKAILLPLEANRDVLQSQVDARIALDEYQKSLIANGRADDIVAFLRDNQDAQNLNSKALTERLKEVGDLHHLQAAHVLVKDFDFQLIIKHVLNKNDSEAAAMIIRDYPQAAHSFDLLELSQKCENGELRQQAKSIHEENRISSFDQPLTDANSTTSNENITSNDQPETPVDQHANGPRNSFISLMQEGNEPQVKMLGNGNTQPSQVKVIEIDPSRPVLISKSSGQDVFATAGFLVSENGKVKHVSKEEIARREKEAEEYAQRHGSRSNSIAGLLSIPFVFSKRAFDAAMDAYRHKVSPEHLSAWRKNKLNHDIGDSSLHFKKAMDSLNEILSDQKVKQLIAERDAIKPKAGDLFGEYQRDKASKKIMDHIKANPELKAKFDRAQANIAISSEKQNSFLDRSIQLGIPPDIMMNQNKISSDMIKQMQARLEQIGVRKDDPAMTSTADMMKRIREAVDALVERFNQAFKVGNN